MKPKIELLTSLRRFERVYKDALKIGREPTPLNLTTFLHAESDVAYLQRIVETVTTEGHCAEGWRDGSIGAAQFIAQQATHLKTKAVVGPENLKEANLSPWFWNAYRNWRTAEKRLERGRKTEHHGLLTVWVPDALMMGLTNLTLILETKKRELVVLRTTILQTIIKSGLGCLEEVDRETGNRRRRRNHRQARRK